MWDYEGYGLSPYVYQGASDRNYDQRVKVKRSISHPSYAGGPNVVPYDIALVELNSDINNVDLMVLSPNRVQIGTILTFAGYGVTSWNGSGSGTKRYTEIEVFDHFNPDYYSSYDPNTNVCSGDSGGPSFLEEPEGRIQYGVNRSVASYGNDPCVGGWNDSTRVDYHLSWIQGYVPQALTDFPEPDTDTDTDTDSDTDADADADSDADVDADTDADTNLPDNYVDFDDDQLDDPVLPQGPTYPTGVRCAVAPTSGLTSLLVLGVVGLLRRRSALR
jgi:hypothetical protein